jgi:hypothetical protein
MRTQVFDDCGPSGVELWSAGPESGGRRRGRAAPPARP